MSDERCKTCGGFKDADSSCVCGEEVESSFSAPTGSPVPGQIAPERALAWDILSALDAANMSVNHPAKAAVDVIESAIRRAQEND